MEWYLWLIFGLMLLGIEAALSGVVAVFFGIGALLAALVALAFGLEVQLVVFIASSILLLVLFRKRFRDKLLTPKGHSESEDPMHHLLGQIASAETTFEALGRGRVAIQGSTWTALSLSPFPLQAGQALRIVHHEGIVLHIEGLQDLSALPEPSNSDSTHPTHS
jgi:membrane protein implicated in regulation of membrane protease activity